tara:strand:- start:269 stop:460 length:192 start_codon:yes stop_codon:yes gene_type:complete
MKTLKLTDKQLEQLSMCFHMGYEQTYEVDDDNLDNGFVKEKDIKRKHKIMDNVLRKISKAERK